MQAITTKFLGPANFRGSRVKARCGAGQITIDWDHSIDGDENHVKAARALCKKIHAEVISRRRTRVTLGHSSHFSAKSGWEREFATGFAHDGTGVHVFV